MQLTISQSSNVIKLPALFSWRAVQITVLGKQGRCQRSEFGICNMVRLFGYGEQKRFSMLTVKGGEVA